MTENKNVGLIILAAGSSSRFGTQKQLAEFEGKSLIRRAVENAVASDCEPVIVVLGSGFDLIKPEIEKLSCEIVLNENWQTGMSSSISKGLKKLLEISPNISGAVITLCDQPFVNNQNFNELLQKFYDSEKPIIAAEYKETFGVPALFSQAMFSGLMNLTGDGGAKQFIKNNLEAVEKIPLADAAIDIDTKADFEKLKFASR